MDDLLCVLGEHAAGFTDGAIPLSPWQVMVNPASMRINASTKHLWGTPEEAWHAAQELRDAIVGLGYELGGESEVGARTEPDPAVATPGVLRTRGWRGFINIVVSTRLRLYGWATSSRLASRPRGEQPE